MQQQAASYDMNYSMRDSNSTGKPINRFRASYLGPHRLTKTQKASAGSGKTEQGQASGAGALLQQKIQSQLPVKKIPTNNDIVQEVWSSETPPETGRAHGMHQGPRKATFDIASPQDVGSPGGQEYREEKAADQASPHLKKSEVSDEPVHVFSNVTFCQNPSLVRSSQEKQYGGHNFTTEGSNFPTNRSKGRKQQAPTYTFGRFSSQESQGQVVKQQQFNASEYSDPCLKPTMSFTALQEGIVGSSIFKAAPQSLAVPGPAPPGPPPGLTAPSPSTTEPPKPQPKPQQISIGKQNVVLSYRQDADTSSVKSGKAQSFVGKAAGRMYKNSQRNLSKTSADEKTTKEMQTKSNHNVQNRVQSAIQERRTELLQNFQSSQRSLFKNKPQKQAKSKLNEDLPLNSCVKAPNPPPPSKPQLPLGLKLDQIVAGGRLPSSANQFSEASDSTLLKKITTGDPRSGYDDPSLSLQLLGPTQVSFTGGSEYSREGLRSAPGTGEGTQFVTENVYDDGIKSGRRSKKQQQPPRERPQTEKDNLRRRHDEGAYTNNLEDVLGIGAQGDVDKEAIQLKLNINKIDQNDLLLGRMEKAEGELETQTVVTGCKTSARATQQPNLMKTGASYLKKDDSIDQLKIFVGNMSKRTFGQTDRNLGNQRETTSPPREELSYSPERQVRLDDLPPSEHRQLDRKYKSGGDKSSRRVADSGNLTADFGGEPSFNLASSRAFSSGKGLGAQSNRYQSRGSPQRPNGGANSQLSLIRHQKQQQYARIENLMQPVGQLLREDRRNPGQNLNSPSRQSKLTQSPEQKLTQNSFNAKKNSKERATPNSVTQFDERGDRLKQSYFNHQKTAAPLTRTHANYSALDEQIVKNSPTKRDGLSLPLGSFVGSVFNGDNQSAVHLNVKFSSLREQLQQLDQSKQKVKNEMKALQSSHNQFKTNFLKQENAKEVKKQFDSKRLLNKKMSANHVTYQNQDPKSQQKLTEPDKPHNTVKHSKKVSLMNQKYLSVSNQRQGGRQTSAKSGRAHVSGSGHSHHQSAHTHDSFKLGKDNQLSTQKKVVYMHPTTETTAQASADISAHILASSKSSADISKLDQFQHYPRHVHVYGTSRAEQNNLSTNAKESEGSKEGRDDKSRSSNRFMLNFNQNPQNGAQQAFTTMVQAPKLKQTLQGHPQKLGISAVASLEDLSVHNPSMPNIFQYDEYKGGEDEKPRLDKQMSGSKAPQILPSFHHLDSNFNTSPQRLALPLQQAEHNFESYKDTGEANNDQNLMSTGLKNLASSKFDSASFNVEQQSQGQHISRFSHFQLQEYDGHASTIVKKSDSNKSRASSLKKSFDRPESGGGPHSLNFLNEAKDDKQHLQSSSVFQFKFIKPQPPVLKQTITQSNQNMALFPSQSSLEAFERSADDHMFMSLQATDEAKKNLKFIRKGLSPSNQNSNIPNRNSMSPSHIGKANKRFVSFAEQHSQNTHGQSTKQSQVMHASILRKNHQTISKNIAPMISGSSGSNIAGLGPTTERIKSELQTMQQHIRLLQWQAQEFNQVKQDPSGNNSFSGPRVLHPESKTEQERVKTSARSALEQREKAEAFLKDEDGVEDEEERAGELRPSYFARHSMGTVQGRNASRASGQRKSSEEGVRSRSGDKVFRSGSGRETKLKQIAKKHNININDVFRKNVKRMSLVGHSFRANSTRSALKGRKLTRTPISGDGGQQAIQYQSQRLKQRKNKMPTTCESKTNILRLNPCKHPTQSSDKSARDHSLQGAQSALQVNDKHNFNSVENAPLPSSGPLSMKNKSQKNFRIVSTQILKQEKGKKQQNEQLPSVHQSQQSSKFLTINQSMQNPLLSQPSHAGLLGQSQHHMSISSQDDSSIINILEVERMEKEYRRMLDQNVILMRQNHQSQIKDLMRLIHEKDVQIQSMEKTHKAEMLAAKKQQSSRDRIGEVYSMIGKVQDNMHTIAEMNRRAQADRVVQTINSSSGSSPSVAIASQRTKNQQLSDRQPNVASFLQHEDQTIAKEHPKSRQPANITLVKQSHTMQDANRQSMLIERPSLLDRKKGPSLVQECIENQQETDSPENIEFRPSFPSKDPSYDNTQRYKQTER